MSAPTAQRFIGRTRTLIVAFALALLLCGALYASVAAEPAGASEKGVCTHGTSIHRGPEGRTHAVVFQYDWTTNRGVRMHKVSHYTRYSAPGGGKWIHDWTRSFSRCHDTVNA